jgi:predicted Rossmann fold flavoprotein
MATLQAVSEEVVDLAIVGAGAAGLMAGICAGRTLANGSRGLAGGAIREQSRMAAPGAPRLVIFDGAKRLGAKILVAGGGRCNVTHDVVDERAFSGSSPNAIKKVLRRFDVPQTIEFFRELNVELKREESGKLFPVTDSARTILSALLGAAEHAGAVIEHPRRVESIERQACAFVLRFMSDRHEVRARRVILATGGKSLPKTGSDGHGYAIAKQFGHSISPRVFPALVPLTLPKNHFLCALSGLSTVATVEVRSSSGKRLHSFTDALLCTHFGISGPAALDISRHYINAKFDDPGSHLLANWLPGETVESVDKALQQVGRTSPSRWLRESRRQAQSLPQRLADALCEQAGVEPAAPGQQLTRERRRALANVITQMSLPIVGNRGFAYAEVTAGGVPLRELHLQTMESRMCPGLYIVGEICDVDGRIGGYNFQWAWASGFVAGTAAARALTSETACAMAQEGSDNHKSG